MVIPEGGQKLKTKELKQLKEELQPKLYKEGVFREVKAEIPNPQVPLVH